MKKILFLSILFSTLFISNSFSQEDLDLHIPANDKVIVEYQALGSYAATIKNKSTLGLEIKVIDDKSKEQIRGFGLGKKAKAEVMVEKTSKLIIHNTNDEKAHVKIKLQEKDFPVADPDRKYASFTLRNTSAKDIPLIIPTVMNPNLSPFSNSGVDLKMGQEIIFKHKGKRYVLITVDEKIKDGDVLDVAKLLKAKKKELGLK